MAWVGEVLPGRCGEGWAGGWAVRSGAARGGWGDWMGLRVGGGRRELGGGEGGTISRQPAPRGAGWREIVWAGFFGGSATKVGAVRGREDGTGDAGCMDVVRGWGGGVSSGRGRFQTGAYERWGTSGGGAGA